MAKTPRSPTNMRVIGSLALQTGDTQAPTTPSSLTATAIAAGRVDLAWTASTDNVGVAGYQVWRNSAPLNTTAATTYSDTTTQPSTTYTYTVSAFDAAGNSSGLATNRVVTTPANAAPVWTNPGTQTLIVGNSYTLNLASFVSDADADTLTFSIVSGTLPSGITRSGALVSGTPTTSGEGQTLVFRVADAFHTVDQTITFNVWDTDATPPLTPSGLTATAVSSSEIDLSWSASTDGLLAGTNTYKVNPAGLAYTSVTNTNLYATRTGMVITGREVHSAPYAAGYAAVRAGGGEVLRYFDVAEIPDVPNAGDDAAFYSGATLWPFPSGSPGTRINFPGTHLSDMRVGSAWVALAVARISAVMTAGEVDGVFLDVADARLYDNAYNTWTSWPQAEKDAWTAGQVDLMRQLDAARRQLNPNFILIGNGYWDGNGSAGLTAEQYLDGICLEHPVFNAYHTNYAAKETFSNLGHRRMLVIAASGDAANWVASQGVTHVSDQATYSAVDTPPTTFNSLAEYVSGTKDYRIYRNGVLRTTVAAPATTYRDTGLPIGAQYTYTVTARDNSLNESAQSTGVTANVIEFFFSDTSPTLSAPTTGTANMPFTVTSSATFGFNVIFDYTTQDGTAIAGTDYTATSGTATLVAGQTQYVINVPILANVNALPNKTFTMRLYNFRQG